MSIKQQLKDPFQYEKIPIENISEEVTKKGQRIHGVQLSEYGPTLLVRKRSYGSLSSWY